MSETISQFEDIDTELELLEFEEELLADDDGSGDKATKIPGYDTEEFEKLRLYYLDLAKQIAAHIDSLRASYTDWHQRAVCSFLVDKDMFFGGPEGGSNTLKDQNAKIAIAICGICTVREQCYKEGLDYEDAQGVRAGMSVKELKKAITRKSKNT